MAKVSKAGKARLKRMGAGERKQVMKAARLLADADCITRVRFDAIERAARSAIR